MARNRRFADADQLTLPVPAYCVSGSPVIVGMIPGVCLTTRDAAGNATVRSKGVFELTPAGTSAITVGAPIYITSATGVLGVAAGAGIQLFGHAVTARGAVNVPIRVRVAQFAVAVDTPA
jgi:predicted RecA/RadA family phage recombinase